MKEQRDLPELRRAPEPKGGRVDDRSRRGEVALLRAQRTAGNAALANVLAPTRQPAERRAVVQRGEEEKLPPDRQPFINNCNSTPIWVAAQSHFLLAFAERLGADYNDAHTMYSKVIAKQSGAEKIIDDLLLDATLAFIPGGKGVKGVIGSAMGEGGNFIISGAKDIISTDMDKFVKMGVAGDMKEKFGPITSLPPVNKDPVRFRADVVSRVHEISGKTQATLAGWSKAAADPKSKADFNFDPDALVKNAFKVEGVQVDAGLKAPGNAALLFEKGMWKAHVTTMTLTEEEHFRENESGERDEKLGPGAGVHTGGFKIGRKIRGRIKECASALGENGDDWIREWGVEMRAAFSRRSFGGEKERWNGDQFSLL